MASIENTLTKVMNVLNPTKSTGKILMALNALGIAFAAASNTFAAATDKNTSAEDKKFLVPAGAVTGIANVGIYLGMTNKIVNYLEKDFTDKVQDIMLSKKTYETASKIFNDDKIKIAAKNQKDKYVKNMVESLKDHNGNLTPFAKEEYYKSISKGFGVAGAFIGAIVGCAIITPILRDVSAYLIQKYREKKNPSMQDKPYMPYFDPSHIGSGKYGRVNKMQPLSMTSYMAFTNGRTRV